MSGFFLEHRVDRKKGPWTEDKAQHRRPIGASIEANHLHHRMNTRVWQRMPKERNDVHGCHGILPRISPSHGHRPAVEYDEYGIIQTAIGVGNEANLSRELSAAELVPPVMGDEERKVTP